VAHDDVGVGDAARQVDSLGQLRMKHPGVERQPERGQPREPGAEFLALHVVRTGRDSEGADDRARVPRRRMAHAAEAPAAGADVRLQHGLDPLAEREVGEAHDAGGDPRRSVLAAIAHGRHAGDELGLAHRPHLHGAVGAIHRVALEEHGGDHVVAGAEVGQQLVEQVAMIRPDPQMMVRVDDRQVRLEDRLGRRLGQPRLVGGVDPAVLGRARMG
jgi:hypothetical protein